MTIVGRALVAILLAVMVVGCTASAPTSTLAPSGAAAATVQGEAARVVRIVDGDTIIVDRGSGREERLRYIGIDTPETVKPESRVERFGPEASAANKRLVEGHDVILERDISDRDQFDRLLRYVWVDTQEGLVMVNEELVSMGLAEVKTYRPDTKHQERLRAAESAARDAGVGMHRR